MARPGRASVVRGLSSHNRNLRQPPLGVLIYSWAIENLLVARLQSPKEPIHGASMLGRRPELAVAMACKRRRLHRALRGGQVSLDEDVMRKEIIMSLAGFALCALGAGITSAFGGGGRGGGGGGELFHG